MRRVSVLTAAALVMFAGAANAHPKLVSATRDRNGAVIEGNPDGVTDVTDVWTFARDTSSRDPNWKLVGTEAGQ